MKKSILRRVVFGVGLLAISAPAFAQPAPTYPGYAKINYIGINFTFTAPTAIAGAKDYTISNDGTTSTSNWGGAITTNYLNTPVIKIASNNGSGQINDSACGVVYNGQTYNNVAYPSLVGKFAFIRRGNCEFGAKALAAQQAGAIGVIIANQLTGGPVSMGAGAVGTQVTIPVLMISDVDGNAVEAQLNSNVPVTVTITGWQSGFTHDISILKSGVAQPHAYAIPISQLGTANGNPTAYKFLTGAFIANFGTSNETNVKLVNNVTFTPTGGTAASVYSDSVLVGNFTTIDSVIVPHSATTYDPHPAGTGRYDATYTLSLAATDQSSTDNTQTASMYVTDSVFSKGPYDVVKGKPIISDARGSSTNSFVWGPIYYVAKGGYLARKVQFSVSEGTATQTFTNLSNLSPMTIYMWKWKDNNGDNKIQNSELTLRATATKSFTVTDSNRSDSVITVNWKNYPTASQALILDSGMYWVAADLPAGSFLGMSHNVNYYPRAYFQSIIPAAGSKAQLYSPVLDDNEASIALNPAVNSNPFPGESATATIDSVQFLEEGKGLTANIALLMSKNPAPSGITESNGPDNFKNITLFPNPASNLLTVKVQLDQAAKHVYYSIVDGVGRVVSRFNHDNVTNEDMQVPVSSLAAGHYYLVIVADGDTAVREFTIAK